MNQALPHRIDPRDFGTLLERLLAIADDAVVVCDSSQRIVVFNEGAERVFGHRIADALGQPLAMLLPESSRGAHEHHVRTFGQAALAARRMGDRREIHGRRADGSLFDAEASISHVELGGQTYFTAIVRDVTEQRRAEHALERAKSEAEAAARAKSLFLANMSHEIRTPLNAVIGMTTLLLDTPMSEDQRDFARTIRGSGETLLEIINDILDYSKADVGKLELEQLAFDLRLCVEESLDLVTPRALEKGLNLAYLIEDGTPEALIGDRTRVRQILVNLLSNAVKFTHQGEVFVALDGQLQADGRCKLHIAVKDSGIGIAAEHLPRLFQSFTQVDASTTRRFGGTGLGLAISKRLAELMGGSVGAESEPGHGSTFHVTLMVDVAEQPPAAEYALAGGSALAGKRILVVDDNLTNRRILTKLALRWGMLPSTLPSALEALDRIRHGEGYDVAVLDMSMPEIDGLDLALEIRRRRSASELPIVLLTSLGQRPSEAAHVGVELAACLSKPIKTGQLYATLVAVTQGLVHAVEPPAPESPLRPPPQRQPVRVLVAEDNPVNQRVALRLLRHLGYQADLASDGLQALQAVERNDYDLVLMDIQMPEMDGLQAARELVRRRGAVGRPRIVAMTANAMPGDREAYIAAGMDGYVAKPIQIEELAATLGHASAMARQPQHPAGHHDGVLDHARLEHLRTMQDDSQPSLVRELIDMFLAESSGHVARLSDALHGGNATALRALAHRFLSMTQNIGARRLSALCEEVERLAKAEQLDAAQRLLQDVHHERQRVHDALAAARMRY
jgi:PAS domain S-box-containing protein